MARSESVTIFVREITEINFSHIMDNQRTYFLSKENFHLKKSLIDFEVSICCDRNVCAYFYTQIN